MLLCCEDDIFGWGKHRLRNTRIDDEPYQSEQVHVVVCEEFVAHLVAYVEAASREEDGEGRQRPHHRLFPVRVVNFYLGNRIYRGGFERKHDGKIAACAIVRLHEVDELHDSTHPNLTMEAFKW